MPVWFRFRRNKLHWFDKSTGQRIHRLKPVPPFKSSLIVAQASSL